MGDPVENYLPRCRLGSLNRVLLGDPVQEDVQFRYFGNPTAVDFAVQLDHELHSHSLSPTLQNSALGAAFENLRRGKVWRLRSWTRWGLGARADGERSTDRAFRSQVDTGFQGISLSRNPTCRSRLAGSASKGVGLALFLAHDRITLLAVATLNVQTKLLDSKVELLTN